MELLAAVMVLGAVVEWSVARFAPEVVSAVLGVVVLASVLGLVPLGRLGRRVLVRTEQPGQPGSTRCRSRVPDGTADSSATVLVTAGSMVTPDDAGPVRTC